MRRYFVKAIIMMALMLPVFSISQASSVRVVALFSGKAMVFINGKRHLLKVGGSTVQGVRLVSADSRKAVIENNGIRKTYSLTRDMGQGITQPELKIVTITRTSSGQYLTQGMVNGGRVQMLVDTGANVVALNNRLAQRLGIRYKDGEKVRAETAAGNVDAYRVRLDSVSVGSIRVTGVSGTVIEDSTSDTVLLGMSYLKNVSLSEEGGVMTLQARY